MIAAVNGPAAGIGCSLALACDLIVAAESAFFLLAFVNIGLVPDGGTHARPFRPASGAARAAEMAMLGERVPARDSALEWGLINRVVPDAELEQAARRCSPHLAARPDQRLREHQAAAQPQPLRRPRRAARRRGRGPARTGPDRGLHRGRDRLRGETAAQVHRNLSGRSARSARVYGRGRAPGEAPRRYRS